MASDGNVEILAGRFRAANAMGRSDSLKKLFDFLVARSADAAAPKEAEVAAAIFGAGANFDASQDASVRVYIHRLRQKLDEYYEKAGQGESERLVVPKGIGYRIQAAAAAPPVPKNTVPDSNPRRNFLPHMVVAGFVLLVLINLAGWAWLVNRPAAPADALATVRANPVWSAFLNDNRPTIVVVGDYYIFGEVTDSEGNNRLVREYTINSPSDLDNYLMQHPGMNDRYMDLDLYYLPVSAASALRSIMPVLAPNAAARDRVRIVQASDLTPDMLKHNNIVYVGYLSGLGILKDLVFSGSRFSIGETYDDLVDNVGKKHYDSQEGGPDPQDRKLRDYGYFSTFTGPDGNHIMVIAGTRDVAVMQTAEAVSERDSLGALEDKARHAPSYEALYEVEGIRRINLGGHLIVASPLRSDMIWNNQPAAMQFPKG